MSKVCKNCGEVLKDTARTCTKCGSPADPPEQPYLNRPVKTAAEMSNGTDDKEAKKSDGQNGSRKSPAVIIAVILVVLILVGAVFAFVYFKDGNNNSDKAVTKPEAQYTTNISEELSAEIPLENITGVE